MGKPKRNKPPPTPQQLAILRRVVMEDPNTAKIAAAVNMKLDDYIEQVLKFAADPALEPTFTFVPDEELRKQGHNPPDRKKIMSFVKGIADARRVTKSKFADPNSQREKVDGAIPQEPAATAKPGEVREDLKAEVDLEISSGRYKKL